MARSKHRRKGRKRTNQRRQRGDVRIEKGPRGEIRIVAPAWPPSRPDDPFAIDIGASGDEGRRIASCARLLEVMVEEALGLKVVLHRYGDAVFGVSEPYSLSPIHGPGIPVARFVRQP